MGDTQDLYYFLFLDVQRDGQKYFGRRHSPCSPLDYATKSKEVLPWELTADK